MTLDEIKARMSTYEDSLGLGDKQMTWAAEDRAALLKAVEELELEAAKADSWRQAAEGFRRERDEARSTLSTLRAERDRLAAESRRSTLRSMAVVGALMARGPGVVTLGAQQLADALLPRIESRPGGGVRLVLGTTTLGEEMDRMDASSPRAESEGTETLIEWTDDVLKAHGRCTRCGARWSDCLPHERSRIEKLHRTFRCAPSEDDKETT